MGLWLRKPVLSAYSWFGPMGIPPSVPLWCSIDQSWCCVEKFDITALISDDVDVICPIP